MATKWCRLASIDDCPGVALSPVVDDEPELTLVRVFPDYGAEWPGLETGRPHRAPRGSRHGWSPTSAGGTSGGSASAGNRSATAELAPLLVSAPGPSGAAPRRRVPLPC
ncbi:protein of unknown function [Blastococcus saxobsidens DD2]|uniref:Uncharacterized protein n=1 Tax=Blastococcus saxobsidens (strain DD2) TaxID=1146883 RepID=H6RMF2_BLASD|nr:protein of unknown function [Blastococcus saxobsidens DD2]